MKRTGAEKKYFDSAEFELNRKQGQDINPHLPHKTMPSPRGTSATASTHPHLQEEESTNGTAQVSSS